MTPFTLVPPDDEHPSGCPEDCHFPLHLTPAGLATLRSRAVPEAAIRAALAHEARSHAEAPITPGTSWTPRVEATLSRLGVPAGVIDAARAHVERKTARSARRTLSAASRQAEQVKSWKAANPDRVKAHAAAYRARRRLQVVT